MDPITETGSNSQDVDNSEARGEHLGQSMTSVSQERKNSEYLEAAEEGELET